MGVHGLGNLIIASHFCKARHHPSCSLHVACLLRARALCSGPVFCPVLLRELTGTCCNAHGNAERGDFVGEYVGEIFELPEFERRHKVSLQEPLTRHKVDSNG